MKACIKILFWGLLISFLGSLPPGTMNIAATHISIAQGRWPAMGYAFGSMLAEIIIVRMALVSMGWLSGRQKIFRLLEYFTTALLMILAIGSFIAAYKMTGFSNAVPLLSFNPFWSGVFLSVTNPLHIPFWLGWSTVLMNKGILQPQPTQYNWYVAGIGAGTILGFMVFIFGGTYFVAKITAHQDLLNLAIGIILLITAVLQLKKIITVPVNVRYGKMMGTP